MKKLILIFSCAAITLCSYAQSPSFIQAQQTDENSDTLMPIFTEERTGINEESALIDLTPYPNPSTGTYTFKLNNPVAVEIYNANGLMVYQRTMRTGYNTIDLTNQPNGLYFVKFISDAEKVVENQTLVKF